MDLSACNLDELINQLRSLSLFDQQSKVKAIADEVRRRGETAVMRVVREYSKIVLTTRLPGVADSLSEFQAVLLDVGAPAVPALMALVQTPRIPRARMAVATLLGFLKDARAIPALQFAMEKYTQDQEFASAAAAAIRNLGGKVPVVVPPPRPDEWTVDQFTKEVCSRNWGSDTIYMCLHRFAAKGDEVLASLMNDILQVKRAGLFAGGPAAVVLFGLVAGKNRAKVSQEVKRLFDTVCDKQQSDDSRRFVVSVLSQLLGFVFVRQDKDLHALAASWASHRMPLEAAAKRTINDHLKADLAGLARQLHAYE